MEAALVTPLVLALLFGIVEFGFFFKDYLASAGAVRAGVRIASATPRNSTFAQAAADQVALSGGAINFKDLEELWVYKVGTGTNKPCNNGTSDQEIPCTGRVNFNNCNVCVKFKWNGTRFVPRPGQAATEVWQAESQNACSSSGPGGPPDQIGVYLQLKHDAFTKFVFSSVTISEASIMSLEPMSSVTGCGPTP